MSDDLVKRLRGSCYLAFDDGTNDYASALEAADRVEELEAKLAKAVAALENAERLISGGLTVVEWKRACNDFFRDTRATLKELKGG